MFFCIYPLLSLYLFKVDPDDLATIRKYDLKFKMSEESEAFTRDVSALVQVLKEAMRHELKKKCFLCIVVV